jgi:5-methylcytosine-specific restriction endonuclease McrA
MNRYSLTHVPDPTLLRDLRALLARERATTAELLAHLAEVDTRHLYAAAGYPSMFAYCVDALRLSVDAAYKRIQAARTARRFPVIFSAVADGRLNLSGVVLLAPHLGEANADETLAAVAGRTKTEIEEWLARRFPRSELLPLVTALPAVQGPDDQLAPGRVEFDDAQLAPGQVETDDHDDQLAPERVAALATPARLAPVAPERYSLQLTIGKGTHDKLRYAQALLGHQVPSSEVAEVLDRALEALIRQLERRKFAATDRPRGHQRTGSANPRHVPAGVRRAVWERDGGRCTFVSAAGHRCAARTRLEFDHVEPVARGGHASVNGVRLRCRTHNQYAAECEFGAGFMSRKREAAQHAAREARVCAAATEEARAHAAEQAEGARARAAAVELARAHAARAAAAAEQARARAAAAEEVVPWLHALGLRIDEARRRAASCDIAPDAPLEERVRDALRCSGRRSGRCATNTPQTVP